MWRNSWLFFLCWPLLVWANDPMRPPGLETAPSEMLVEPLRLSMILAGQGRQRAVINGKVLAVGEQVGNARLLAIGKDHVVMTQAGQRVELRLPVSFIRQTDKGKMHE